MEDNRINIAYTHKFCTKNMPEIWALAYYALKDSKSNKLYEMQDRIKTQSKTQSETLRIIEDYVCVNGRPKPKVK